MKRGSLRYRVDRDRVRPPTTPPTDWFQIASTRQPRSAGDAVTGPWWTHHAGAAFVHTAAAIALRTGKHDDVLVARVARMGRHRGAGGVANEARGRLRGRSGLPLGDSAVERENVDARPERCELSEAARLKSVEKSAKNEALVQELGPFTALGWRGKSFASPASKVAEGL